MDFETDSLKLFITKLAENCQNRRLEKEFEEGKRWAW